MAGHEVRTFLQLFTVLLMCCPTKGFTVDDESSLRTEILTGYSREVRPEAVTEVSLQIHVTAINSVDIRNEVFSMSGWWSMVWQDSRLNWTGKYPTIPVVQFNEDRIWSPVLVVSNSIKDLSAIDEDTIPLRVDSTGRVLWNPPALLEVSCSMDVTYFPFDEQICSIEVTSFGYTVQELDMKVYRDGMSFRYYQPSGEWDILETSNSRLEYAEDGYTYARVTFNIRMKRKPLYYGVNMILPVVVNSALTMFVFLLPPESGEKIGYCLTILLTFMVILTLVATDLPTTATSTPILEIYIALVLVLGGLSVILAITVLHIFFLPEEKPIPEWVRRACMLFTRVCWISRVETIDDRKVNPSPRDDVWVIQRASLGPMGLGDPLTKAPDSIAVSASDVQARHPDEDSPEKPSRLSRKHTLKSIEPGKTPKHESDVTWATVASTIDGVCLRFYSLFLVVTTVIILAMLAA